MSDHPSDPARIERDLDQTRSRLGSHLNELQNRLSPGQLLDDMLGYLRGTEGAEFGRNLMDSVRANPLPAALTGIGLTWLMAAGNKRPPPKVYEFRQHYGTHDHAGTLDRIRTAETEVVRGADESDEAYTMRLDEARGKALGLARHAQESAQSFAERVRGALSQAQQALADTAQGVRDSVASTAQTVGDAVQGLGSRVSATAGSLADSARSAAGAARGAADSARSAGYQAADYASRTGRSATDLGGNLAVSVRDNPVILGVLGLAAGALLGSLLPQSEQEERALGGVAEQARDAVQGAADVIRQRGSEVASAVTESVRSAAEEKGLTADRSAGDLLDAALSGDLVRDAKDVAKGAIDQAAEAARGGSSSAPPEGGAGASSGPSGFSASEPKPSIHAKPSPGQDRPSST